MTAESATVLYQPTYDGTQHIDKEITPPSGELWYVESISFYPGGDGTASANIPAYFGIFPTSENPPSDTDVSGGRAGGSPPSMDLTSKYDQNTLQIGTYLSPEETLYILANDLSANQAGTVRVVVHIRRVL